MVVVTLGLAADVMAIAHTAAAGVSAAGVVLGDGRHQCYHYHCCDPGTAPPAFELQ